jgi:hypothetical protein
MRSTCHCSETSLFGSRTTIHISGIAWKLCLSPSRPVEIVLEPWTNNIRDYWGKEYEPNESRRTPLQKRSFDRIACLCERQSHRLILTGHRLKIH